MRGVSFEVRAGEIVGIAGVDGNGQTELIDAITGLRRAAIRRDQRRRARTSRGASARGMLDAGVGHIPEDRQRRGLVLEFSIAENIALHDYAEPPERAVGLALPEAARRAGDDADRGVRRARRRPADPRRAASRAATSRRSSSRARSPATRRC